MARGGYLFSVALGNRQHSGAEFECLQPVYCRHPPGEFECRQSPVLQSASTEANVISRAAPLQRQDVHRHCRLGARTSGCPAPSRAESNRSSSVAPRLRAPSRLGCHEGSAASASRPMHTKPHPQSAEPLTGRRSNATTARAGSPCASWKSSTAPTMPRSHARSRRIESLTRAAGSATWPPWCARRRTPS